MCFFVQTVKHFITVCFQNCYTNKLLLLLLLLMLTVFFLYIFSQSSFVVIFLQLWVSSLCASCICIPCDFWYLDSDIIPVCFGHFGLCLLPGLSALKASFEFRASPASYMALLKLINNPHSTVWQKLTAQILKKKHQYKGNGPFFRIFE